MVISEELKRELGNAISAYGDVLYSALLGINVPQKFQFLTNCSEDELKHKMDILKEFHNSL